MMRYYMILYVYDHIVKYLLEKDPKKMTTVKCIGRGGHRPHSVIIVFASKKETFCTSHLTLRKLNNVC